MSRIEPPGVPSNEQSDPVPAVPAAATERPPEVLELRVHGVNNTTPAALLDLPDDQVTLKSGDKLGSFWQPKPGAGSTAEGRRGFIPDGITREAYSWGGMVRTSPNFGGVGAAGAIAGVLARIFYALILPFSIGNAVQWTRRLTLPGDSVGRRAWTAVASGLSRLFGVILTLLFTTTVATLAIDIGALQCAAVAARCEPLEALFEPMEAWTPGQRVALLALVPVAAVVALWAIGAVSRLRYDVLPGMEGNSEGVSTNDDVDLPITGPGRGRADRHCTSAGDRRALAAGVLVQPGGPSPLPHAPRCGDRSHRRVRRRSGIDGLADDVRWPRRVQRVCAAPR